MKITYSHAEGIIAEHAKGDELARLAAVSYGHVLNTDKRRNRPHGAREFAQAIRDRYEMTEPHNVAIVAHLESLELIDALTTGPRIAEVAVQCVTPAGETGSFLRDMRTGEPVSPVFSSLAPLFQWVRTQEGIQEIEPARKYHVTTP